MVGIFSRFSVSRNGHRRSQSALQGDREAIPPTSDATSDATVTGGATAATHGIEVAIEFKPLEHPPEPLDNDRPIQCPLPEPSILNNVMPRFMINRYGLLVGGVIRVLLLRGVVGGIHCQDGRIWKERVSAGGGQRRAEMPVMQEGPPVESGPVGKKPPRPPSNRVILPSISAPEHSLLKLLEECSPSGI
ncbi:hypothetical protein RHMOL_Rhmol07G0161400 [Rhododendron molle]|uniref:Uncharacterized protein n=1 Tax=Rhododendron molle TaxID=49168 RepID=A0ACC0N2C4_RHOML|nr:hypothetical protein RHMOL_Rhmol07G0161400 [Rhododendron molle]